MVQIGNEVILIGGFSNDGTQSQNQAYKLSCVSEDCTWESMAPLQLSVARQFHVALVVPDNFVDCP